MEIPFIKMESSGNCYFLIQEESINRNINVSNLAERISDKYSGIGSDGLLVLSNKYRPIPQVEIYNSDGSNANVCVNGLAIVGTYLHETKHKNKETIKIKIKNDVYDVLNDNNHIVVKIPINHTIKEDTIFFNNNKYTIYHVNSVNNHIYLINDGSISFNYFKSVLGKHLSKRYNANVGLINIINKNYISMMTYEKGSKLTKSSGSNICGGVYLVNQKRMINNQVTVESLGGNIEVNLDDEFIYYTSDVNLICKGTYYM